MALATVLTACGSRVEPETPRVAAATGQPAVVSSESTEAAGQPRAEGSPGSTAASADQAGGAQPSPSPSQDTYAGFRDAGPDHNTNVTIALARACIARGELQTATISAGPRAGVAMVVGYADRNSRGQIGAAQTDATGTFVWRFTIPLDAPPGDAVVLANATGRDWNPDGSGGTAGGGSASAEFTVAGPAGC